MSYDEHKEARLELAELRQRLADVQAEHRKAGESWDRQRERITDGWRDTNRECIKALNRAEAAEAQVATVRALHQPLPWPAHHGERPASMPPRCGTCWGDGNFAEWPCATFAALSSSGGAS